MNDFAVKIKEYKKEKDYIEMLCKMINFVNIKFIRGTEDWKTQTRKRMLALLLFTHFVSFD
jgi:hypothetical protein